jgi:microcystin-dependent protein
MHDTWAVRNAMDLLEHVQKRRGWLAYCNGEGCDKVWKFSHPALQHTAKARGAANKAVNCGHHTIPLDPEELAAHLVTLEAAVAADAAEKAEKAAAAAAQAERDAAAKAAAKAAVAAKKAAAKMGGGKK